LLTDLLGRRTPLPRVTLLILFGFAIGPGALDLLPAGSREWFPIATNIALVMVGFLLGGGLSLADLRDHGRSILAISAAKALGAFAVVGGGLLALGFPVEVALLLAAIATATAPAATADVVHELRSDGPMSRTLLGVVALDDAWALVLFSLTIAALEAVAGMSGGEALWLGLREVGGALLLGVGLGVPSAYLTGRVDPGEPTLAEALGIVFLCGGLAIWLDVSLLIAAMALGATIASLARHHRRPFHAIEGIEWPFMILFFVLAGASLALDALSGLGALLAAYVVLRSVGTYAGTWLGASPLCVGRDQVEPTVQRWLGLALLPQAGVALAMALIAVERFPALAPEVLHLTIAATVLFELAGPVLTRLALRRAGEPA
jgi:Kef-type K+ transport system membrane component KefB